MFYPDQTECEGEQAHPTFYKYLPGEEVPVPFINPILMEENLME